MNSSLLVLMHMKQLSAKEYDLPDKNEKKQAGAG